MSVLRQATERADIRTARGKEPLLTCAYNVERESPVNAQTCLILSSRMTRPQVFSVSGRIQTLMDPICRPQAGMCYGIRRVLRIRHVGTGNSGGSY